MCTIPYTDPRSRVIAKTTAHISFRKYIGALSSISCTYYKRQRSILYVELDAASPQNSLNFTARFPIGNTSGLLQYSGFWQRFFFSGDQFWEGWGIRQTGLYGKKTYTKKCMFISPNFCFWLARDKYVCSCTSFYLYLIARK